jgi:hypothetical protein
MWIFLSALVWAGVVIYAMHRVERILGLRQTPQLQDTASRAAQRDVVKRTPPIPNDLEALALRESEPWAQDDVRAVIREKYRELEGPLPAETWQAVRRAMGIGEMP